MAAQHCDPPEYGGLHHWTGSLATEDGSRVGVARLGDELALHVESGTATDTAYMTRAEVRELAHRLIDASQNGEEE
jgi:hypothetical protein